MNGRYVKLFAGAALSSVAMFAGSVTLSNLKDTNGSAAPYTVDVNGLQENILCDDDYANDNGISAGGDYNETSFTQVIGTTSPYTNGSDSNLRFGSNYSTTVYEEVAWLAIQELSYNAASPGSSTVQAIQSAIWDLFGGGSGAGGVALSSGYQSWVNMVLTGSTTGGTTNFVGSARQTAVVNMAQDIFILTPVVGSPNSTTKLGPTGGDQEFIMITPEPATYALFGAGLILLSLCTFRRAKKTV